MTASRVKNISSKRRPLVAPYVGERFFSNRKALVSATDGKVNVELVPHDNQIDIALNASKGWIPPVGPQIEFTDLTLKATAKNQRITIENFDSLLYGGAAKGSAMIVWGGPWSIEGEVTTQRIELQHLMAAFTRDAKSTAGSLGRREREVERRVEGGIEL